MTIGSQSYSHYALMLGCMSTSLDTNEEDFDTSLEQLRALKAAYGSVVAHRRIQAGIAQSAFARMAGISNSHLRKIEAGIGNPSLTTQHRIAAALGTNIADLASSALAEATDRCRDNLGLRGNTTS